MADTVAVLRSGDAGPGTVLVYVKPKRETIMFAMGFFFSNYKTNNQTKKKEQITHYPNFKTNDSKNWL